MRATPFLWIAGVVTALVIAFFAYYAMRRWGTKSGLDDIMQNGLLVFTVIGAFWTLWLTAQNNETAWLAFSESTRPSALFRVLTSQPENGEPVSFILYENHSRSDVEKMRAIIKISSGGEAVDLSDMLPKDMLLPAGDSRQRKLLPYSDPKEHGFDLKTKAAAEEKIKLVVGYSFTHGGKRITVPAQQTYMWNPNKEIWELEY